MNRLPIPAQKRQLYSGNKNIPRCCDNLAGEFVTSRLSRGNRLHDTGGTILSRMGGKQPGSEMLHRGSESPEESLVIP